MAAITNAATVMECGFCSHWRIKISGAESRFMCFDAANETPAAWGRENGHLPKLR